MKRLVAVLSGLLVLPAFAEVAPIFYDEVVEYNDTEIADVEDVDAAEKADVVVPVAQPSKVGPRSTASSRAASRAVPSATKSANSRSVSARSTSASRNATQARTGATVTARGAVSARPTSGATRVSARPSRSANVASSAGVTARRATNAAAPVNAARSGVLTQTDTVNTPLYTGRVATRSSGNVQSRLSTMMRSGNAVSVSSDNALAELTDIDELAQNTAYCKAQYTACMDNFCNVLDDNQGRCSCSKNLKNYAETEEALKQATIALEEVGQQIRYIGLTADQVESLFAETEAEMSMSDSKNKDNSDITSQLAKIKKMIITVESGSASSTNTGINFDLNGLLDFGDLTGGFDLNSLNLFNTNSKNTSISNQRGEQLYKTASARCKSSVLDTCAAQGVDTSIITNSYDLEIDKQCIVYERNLTEANETMASTVRNAKTVLQNARLMVAQQKNAYNLRECVEELDNCMREDFVCGDDYENCLDPTGRYIAGGKIVLGSMPGQSTVSNAPTDTLFATWNYEKDGGDVYTWGASGTLGEYVDTHLSASDKELQYMANYLQSKIGYIDENGKAVGMCSGVLNQCQDYTYVDTNKKGVKQYNKENQVIRNYLERTLVQIKAAQDLLIEEYAEDCIDQEVATCLNQNNYDDTKNTVALKACRQQIVTCMSVNGETPSSGSSFTDTEMEKWVLNVLGEDSENVGLYVLMTNCVNSGGTFDGTNCICSTPGYMLDPDGNECVCSEGYARDNEGKCVEISQ